MSSYQSFLVDVVLTACTIGLIAAMSVIVLSAVALAWSMWKAAGEE